MNQGSKCSYLFVTTTKMNRDNNLGLASRCLELNSATSAKEHQIKCDHK